MSDTIAGEQYSKSPLAFLAETFEKVEGIYLDQKTSIIEILAGFSAAEASRVITGGTSIASQVEHLLFYIDITRRYMDGELLLRLIGKIVGSKKLSMKSNGPLF